MVHLSSPSGFCSFFFQSNGNPCSWSIPAQMISLVELAVVGVAAGTQKETSVRILGAKCARLQGAVRHLHGADTACFCIFG